MALQENRNCIFLQSKPKRQFEQFKQEEDIWKTDFIPIV